MSSPPPDLFFEFKGSNGRWRWSWENLFSSSLQLSEWSKKNYLLQKALVWDIFLPPYAWKQKNLPCNHPKKCNLILMHPSIIQLLEPPGTTWPLGSLMAVGSRQECSSVTWLMLWTDAIHTHGFSMHVWPIFKQLRINIKFHRSHGGSVWKSRESMDLAPLGVDSSGDITGRFVGGDLVNLIFPGVYYHRFI